MENSIPRKKNALAMLYSRLEKIEQRIGVSKHEVRLIEMIQFEVMRLKI